MSPERTPANRDPLLIEHLAIDRLDGFARGFALDDFAPGINLIVGPNASGKSRTALALQVLLWPKIAPKPVELTGHLAVRDTHWIVKVDDRGARHSRNNSPVDPPSLSGIPLEQRDRYLLTLHDLLQGDNKSLAEQIQRESAGGYDLNQARFDAGSPKSQPKPGGRKEVHAYKEAHAVTNRLKQDDGDLQRDEASLQDILDEVNHAKDAQRRMKLIERAIEHTNAVEAQVVRQLERDAFADPIGRMTGKEYQAVQDHQVDLARLEQLRQETGRKLTDVREHLAQTGFADVIPAPEILDELRQRQDQLQDAVAELARCLDAIAEQTAIVSRRRARLGDTLTDDHLLRLNDDGLRLLARLTRDTVRVNGELQAQHALGEWVGTAAASENLRDLRSGLEILNRRLQLTDQAARELPGGLVRLALLLAVVLIAVEAVILAIEVSPAWALLAILALPIAGIALRVRPSASATVAASLEHEYTSLSLPQPESWTARAISETNKHLWSQLTHAELDNAKALKWGDLADKRSRMEEQVQTLAEQRDALQADLGIVPADGDWEALRIIADDLRDLRQATDNLGKATERARKTEADGERILAEINCVLNGAGCESATDLVVASTRITSLQDRMAKADAAAATIATLRSDITGRIEPEMTKHRGAIEAIFTDLGIENDDLMTLRALCERVPACQEAMQHLRVAEHLVQSTLPQLHGAPDLVGLDRTALDLELTRAEAIASRHDEYLHRYTQIETEVNRAKRQTQIEDALAQEHVTLDALTDVRAESCARAAAWQLGEFVHQRTRDLNRPPVYKAAQDLFAAFTSGAFTLEFSDDANPTFLARHTATATVLELDKLSSGTRVQLLMAVRLAFIETLEHGYRLPLLLDETLGNTDDMRINAIMDATIEISRRGRQIIYFTAQHEEIAKWRTRLANRAEPVRYKVFDLAEVRGLAAIAEPSIVSMTWQAFTEPEMPEHLDHARARNFFRVPPIDPWRGQLDGAHVWYFFTDVAVLSKLHEYGVTTWGQYNVLRTRTLAPLISGLDELHSRASSRHRALDAALEFWRIGRCAPIDRVLIYQARAFMSSSKEAVCAVAERTGWDGAALIHALRAEKVDGVTDRRIDRFEAYLRSLGRITDAIPHADRVIRAHVLATMNGDLSEDEIDALLQSIA